MVIQSIEKDVGRQLALLNNSPTYVSTKPCKRGHVSARRTKSCACIECEKLVHTDAYYDKYRTDDVAIIRQFTALRLKARHRNIPFTITLDEIDKPEFCPILGIKLNYGWSCDRGGKKHQDKSKASFDKIIPELGYVSGNVKIISLEANRLKSNLTADIAKKIAEYIEGNNNG